MYNSLDKQSVKQNTPIVAIGGCGQGINRTSMIALLLAFVKYLDDKNNIKSNITGARK